MSERDDELVATVADLGDSGVVQNTVEQLEENYQAFVKNPNDVVAVCTECHSDQRDSYMERNIFAQSGQPTPCQFCGGVTVMTFREVRNQILNSLDVTRGIPSGTESGPTYPR